nr:hypothetical protein [Tanacetum cinerariifolium]
MALPPRDQRNQYLRFGGLEYMKANIIDFEERLGRIYGRGIHRMLVLGFESLSAKMDEGLTSRMLMEHKDAQGHSLFTSHAWRRRMSWREFILALGLHTSEEIETAGFGLYWTEGARQIFNKGDLINIPYLLARFLRMFALGRKHEAMIFEGQFVARMAEHFGLLTKQRLQGLTMIV